MPRYLPRITLGNPVRCGLFINSLISNYSFFMHTSLPANVNISKEMYMIYCCQNKYRVPAFMIIAVGMIEKEGLNWNMGTTDCSNT